MTLLFVSITVVLVVSAACSLAEAALYAVRMPYVRELSETDSRAGQTLTNFKNNMGQPISAILIVNTAAHTAGAAIAGAQAGKLFGEAWLGWFSLAFTLAVLFLSEIMPKVAGVTYNRSVSRAIAAPLKMLIIVLYPLVWLSLRISRAFHPDRPAPIAPESEMHQMAAISAEEGSILPFEAELVQNVLRLDEVKARDILTPKSVVFKFAANLTVKDVQDATGNSPYARIPVYDTDKREEWVGLVFREDILKALADDDFGATLKTLARPLGFVPDNMPGHQLLNEFIKRREHMLGVIDDAGEVLGVVTLEDVIESLIGKEIVDETDTIVDMREEARQAATRSKK